MKKRILKLFKQKSDSEEIIIDSQEKLIKIQQQELQKLNKQLKEAIKYNLSEELIESIKTAIDLAKSKLITPKTLDVFQNQK